MNKLIGAGMMLSWFVSLFLYCILIEAVYKGQLPLYLSIFGMISGLFVVIIGYFLLFGVGLIKFLTEW